MKRILLLPVMPQSCDYFVLGDGDGFAPQQLVPSIDGGL